ncbi:MAG TPA: secretion protein [Anaeromyxobacteraceae bacterium]|nr:secretion protein [Anaeromyxobacteraceae bacterium]
MRRQLAAVLPVLLGACAGEAILHGVDEAQANRVVVALSEAGVQGRAERGEGEEAGFTVSVDAADAGRARRVLAERELPRQRPPGFAEVFAKGSLVPTPVEERALYHHALAGELSRSLETLDGVVEARVHLALPSPDPLRPEASRPPRAGVLVKCRPEARARLEALQDGIQSLVAGAAEGLDPASVSVVLAEIAAAPPPAPPPGRPSRLLLGLAAVAAAAGLALTAAALRGRLRLARR